MTKRMTTEDFICRAIEKHGDYYDYSMVEYINAKTKVKIICPKHGVFEQAAHEHLIGKKCNKCSRNLLSQDEFIRECVIIHGGMYDYSLVEYKSRSSVIKIICPVHGVFEQLAGNHMKGCGCNECGGRKQSNTRDFTIKAKAVHGEKYDYSITNYVKANVAVKIICPRHGVFEQIPNNHLRGHGCASCTLDKRLDEEREKNARLFVQASGDIHENYYDYSIMEYINNSTKVSIICPKHGKFEQIPSNHLKGHGCNKCSNNSSKKEHDWINGFNDSDILQNQTIKTANGSVLKPDGYNPKTNTVYEFWGDFWHGNPDVYCDTDTNPRTKTTFGELYNQTQEKIKLIEKSGYTLIQIWENDYDSKP